VPIYQRSNWLGDRDGDDILDPLDNCIDIFNPSQRDYDSNGEGDLCDPICNLPGSLVGDFPLCGYISLAEVVDAINLWVRGEMTLPQIIQLINGWIYSDKAGANSKAFIWTRVQRFPQSDIFHCY
jgi:hypothetical protein